MKLKISLQGKWQDLNRLVKRLIDQGWVMTECDGSLSGFKWTDVVLEKEI